MPDAKLSDLPAATALNDLDIAPVVQGSGASAETRRVSMAQLRASMQADRDLHVRDFGAVGNGATDDVAPIQAAIDAAFASGGGVVSLGARRYLIAAADLDVKPGVTLIGGASGGQRDAGNYNAVPFALILDAARTVRVRRGARLEGLAVLRRGLAPPTTLREAMNAVAAFAGTAVTIGDGTGVSGGNGADARIERLLILGFDRAIVSDFNARVQIRDVLGDNRNGITLSRAYDIARVHGVHFWPFVTGNLGGISLVTNVVTGVANNGSGLIRVTTGLAHGLFTGDIVNLNSIGGVVAANGRFTVTVVNANTIDLQGSVFAGSYTSGGTLVIWTNRRTGTAFRLTDADVCEFVDCFAFGYDVGFDLGTGSQATQIVNCSVDNALAVADPVPIGLRIGGNAYRTKWVGGFLSSQGVTVRVESTSPEQHHIVGAVVNGGTIRTVDLASGALTIEASDLTAGGSLLGTGNPCVVHIQDAALNLTLIGNDLRAATFTAQSDAAMQKMVVMGNRPVSTPAARIGGGTVELMTIPSAAAGLTRRLDIAADGVATLRRRSASLGARLNFANQADVPTNFISVGASSSIAIGGDPATNPNGGLDLGAPGGATAPFSVQIRRISATPVAGDRLAQFQFAGLNSTAAETVFARLSAFSDTVTAGSEAGSISMETRQGGTLTERLRLSSNGTLTLTGPVVLPANPTTALQAATKQYVDLRAPLASPAFTGTPTAPTAADGTNTTQVATTAFVQAASFTTVQDFTSSGTFTRVATAKSYTLRLGGGGGGGGGGARGAPGTATSGGGAGGGAAVIERTILASEITGDLTITVGAGGTGGTGATAASTAGGNGTAGGSSAVTMGGVNVAQAFGGGAGAGGQVSSNAGGGGAAGYFGAGGSGSGSTAGTGGSAGGANGGSGAAGGVLTMTLGLPASGAGGANAAAGPAGGPSLNVGCGGGAGGGTSTGSVAFVGGAGRNPMVVTSQALATGAVGGAGPSGSGAPGNAGSSGSGGGGNVGGVGGAGGAGGRSSGGGGGGSAEGAAGGAGGAGGSGWCQVVVNF